MRLRSRCDAVVRSWKLPLVVLVVVVVVAVFGLWVVVGVERVGGSILG
jgi:hypothetical protein